MTPFATAILKWYDAFGRKELPWQQNKTAYTVWLSQSCFSRLKWPRWFPYYQRFLERFPTVIDLATPNKMRCCTYGQGLLLREAPCLHKAAKIVTEQYGGEFRFLSRRNERYRELDALLPLQLLSSVHKLPHAILDGNVKRTLARSFAVEGWPGQESREPALGNTQKHTPNQDVDSTIKPQWIWGDGCTHAASPNVRCARLKACAKLRNSINSSISLARSLRKEKADKETLVCDSVPTIKCMARTTPQSEYLGRTILFPSKMKKRDQTSVRSSFGQRQWNRFDQDHDCVSTYFQPTTT